MGKTIPVLDRFWAKVQQTESCWLWTAARDHRGYGEFRVELPPARPAKAHRFAYETLVGPIPDGLELDHLCRNRACVNPDHLEPVTGRVNTLRGESPTAQNARKTHCVHGHELPPRPPMGGRRPKCKTCRAAIARRARARAAA